MFRIDTTDASATAPTYPAPGTPGHFNDGDPTGGRLGTVMEDWWCDQIQEEIIAVLNAAGISPAKATNTQLRDAIAYIAAHPASVSTGGTVSAAGSITSTGGNINATAGSISASGQVSAGSAGLTTTGAVSGASGIFGAGGVSVGTAGLSATGPVTATSGNFSGGVTAAGVQAAGQVGSVVSTTFGSFYFGTGSNTLTFTAGLFAFSAPLKLGAGTFFTPSSHLLTLDNTLGGAAQFSNTSGTVTDVMQVVSASTNTTLIQFASTSGPAGSITLSSGTTVAFNTSSDPRLKDDFQPFISTSDPRLMEMAKGAGPLALICRVPVGSFVWKTQPELGRVSGFLSTDVEKERPEAVTGRAGDMRGVGEKLSWAGDVLATDVFDPFELGEGSVFDLLAEVGRLHRIDGEEATPITAELAVPEIDWSALGLPADAKIKETSPSLASAERTWTVTGTVQVDREVSKDIQDVETVSVPKARLVPALEDGGEPTLEVYYEDEVRPIIRTEVEVVTEAQPVTILLAWRKTGEVGRITEANGQIHNTMRQFAWRKTGEIVRPQQLDHSKLVADVWGAAQELATLHVEDRALIAQLQADIAELKANVAS